MSPTDEDHKSLVRELTEELNAGNFEVIEEYLVDGYGEGEDKPTAAEIRRAEAARREAFPDYHEEIQTITTDGEDVTVLYDVTGTHEGAAAPEDLFRYRSVVYTMPPTGNEVFFSVFRRFKITDGQITMWESMQTPLTMLAQLGLDWGQFQSDLPEYLPD